MFTKHQLPDLTEREKAFELHGAWMAAIDAENDLDADTATDQDIEKARQSVTAAAAAYRDLGGFEVTTDRDGNAMRCSACGAPLFEEDEVVDDQATGEVFLRIAIGLPPRAKTQDLPDVEDAA